MNLSDLVLDSITDVDIDFTKLEAGQVRDLSAVLSAMQREVLSTIKSNNPADVDQKAARAKRLNGLIAKIEKQVNATYQVLSKRNVSDLEEVVGISMAATKNSINNAIGGNLMKGGISKSDVISIVKDTLIPDDAGGAPISERWRRLRDTFKLALRDGLRQAVATQKNTDEMLKVIRGNRNVQFKDGLFYKNQTQMETLIRTAQNQMVNASRYTAYQANADVVKGVQAQAVLDLRTTVICRYRNGMAWTLAGRAFAGTPEPFPGPPPWHWRCRTTLIPIFRSLDDLQGVVEPRLHRILVDLDSKVPIDGKPGQVIGFDKWLSQNKTSARIDAVGGVGKYKLYKEGKIGLSDLINGQGQEKTLKQLKTELGLDDADE